MWRRQACLSPWAATPHPNACKPGVAQTIVSAAPTFLPAQGGTGVLACRFPEGLSTLPRRHSCRRQIGPAVSPDFFRSNSPRTADLSPRSRKPDWREHRQAASVPQVYIDVPALAGNPAPQSGRSYFVTIPNGAMNWPLPVPGLPNWPRYPPLPSNSCTRLLPTSAT